MEFIWKMRNKVIHEQSQLRSCKEGLSEYFLNTRMHEYFFLGHVPVFDTIPVSNTYPIRLVYLNSWFVLETTFYKCHCTCLLFIIAFKLILDMFSSFLLLLLNFET
jgi:hypothetical protein